MLVVGCGAPTPSHPAPSPPCFSLYPLAPGARWTYDVDVTAGEGSASTTQHMRVVRQARELAADRVVVASAPLPSDSAVGASATFRIGSAGIFEGDDAVPEQLLIVPKPEQHTAWGGSPAFFPPGDGRWKPVDFEDLPPYHDCVKVHAHDKYGDQTHVYCTGVGPVVSEYHERAPVSHEDASPGHHRDEVWKLVDFAPGACAR